MIGTTRQLDWQNLSLPVQTALIEALGNVTNFQTLASVLTTSQPKVTSEVCRAIVESKLQRRLPSLHGQDMEYVWVDSRISHLSKQSVQHAELFVNCVLMGRVQHVYQQVHQQLQQEDQQGVEQQQQQQQQQALHQAVQQVLLRALQQLDQQAVQHSEMQQAVQQAMHQAVAQALKLVLHRDATLPVVQKMEEQLIQAAAEAMVNGQELAQTAIKMVRDAGKDLFKSVATHMLQHMVRADCELRQIPLIMNKSGKAGYARVWVTVKACVLDRAVEWLSSPEFKVYDSLYTESLSKDPTMGPDQEDMEASQVFLTGIRSIRADELVIEVEPCPDSWCLSNALRAGMEGLLVKARALNRNVSRVVVSSGLRV